MLQDEQSITLYNGYEGPCSYLEGQTSNSVFFLIDHLVAQTYESLLGQNWRRSGKCVYRPRCSNCSLCQELRLSVADFVPSASQRRVRRKNDDLTVEISTNIAAADALDLYARYQVEWHQAQQVPDPVDVIDFLGISPVETILMRYSLDNRLVGAGWVDLLDTGLSSVYFAFDPSQAHRSLGTFSLLQEIKLSASLQKKWLYLGYWVKGSKTMDYKAKWRPHQVLSDGQWLGQQILD